VVPPGGFHFIETFEGREKRIDGDSFENVARNLLLFRLANQRPPGNPSADVSNFVCTRWPHYCTDTAPREVAPTNSMQTPGGLAGRIAAWMSDLLKLQNDTADISSAVAESRAEICAKCPVNVSYVSGCGACMDNIQRLSFVFRAGRTLPADPMLQGCAATGQHNPSAVWAKNLPQISPDDAAKMPSNCWRFKGV
jgi:hypothetical protein